MTTVSDYLYAKASQKKIPLGGTFELSPVCNFSCKMCYVRKTHEQIRSSGKRLREWSEWLELARQCRDAGMLYLLLTGGEPFLYPNFRELYIALHKMGFILSINSNGTMIDDAVLSWLKEYAPSRVNITLYGASPETYRRICGQADGFHRTLHAIDSLSSAGIPVVINASMIPENAEDMEKIIDIGKARNLNTRVATYMFPPARREREETDSRFTPEESAAMYLRKARYLLDDGEYEKMLKNWVNKAEQPVSGDDWGESQEEFMRCRAGRSSFWVAWDGTMTACGMLPFPLEVYPFAENFMDCWLRLTERVRTTAVLAGCAGCERKELCKPCVAMLHAETGNVNEKAPYLCRMSECTAVQMRKEWEARGCE